MQFPFKWGLIGAFRLVQRRAPLVLHRSGPTRILFWTYLWPDIGIYGQNINFIGPTTKTVIGHWQVSHLII